ncbi:MAG: glutathione peroxidase [Deltaproteobacteria bacterium]|jgi:glutathione peroxidase|nr:glutathione peroxidase [Deltaproteobacteria bacterium]
MTTFFDFEVRDIQGRDRKLDEFAGRVCLVVNVASQCGLTPQYDGLQRLYDRYRERGLEILAFPCNQFGEQEPGSDEEIHEFCTTQYATEFELFSKLEVNGEGRHPLYAWLTEAETGPDAAGDVAWNFAKFLVGRDGRVVARFAPPVEPCAREVIRYVERALEASA